MRLRYARLINIIIIKKKKKLEQQFAIYTQFPGVLIKKRNETRDLLDILYSSGGFGKVHSSPSHVR